MRGIETWAGSFIDREIREPKTGRVGTVQAAELGKRKRGIWLRLSTGDSVYRPLPRGLRG